MPYQAHIYRRCRCFVFVLGSVVGFLKTICSLTISLGVPLCHHCVIGEFIYNAFIPLRTELPAKMLNNQRYCTIVTLQLTCMIFSCYILVYIFIYMHCITIYIIAIMNVHIATF